MRVLVADDNAIFREVLEQMLTGWGYHVVTAADGDEAWSHLQAEAGPELALLDWIMPGPDGIELCRRVRTSNRRTSVYIIIVTLKADPDDLRIAIEAGADDFVSKPFRSADIRLRLRAGSRILALQRPRAAAEMSPGL
jgi:CheY-like chemotaxis protein